MAQGVPENRTGSPSTRTSPIAVWVTVGQSPSVSGSWSTRSPGVCTAEHGTPAPRSSRCSSNLSCADVHTAMCASSASWFESRRSSVENVRSSVHGASMTAANRRQSVSSRQAIATQASSPADG